jgi:hypothetical protein
MTRCSSPGVAEGLLRRHVSDRAHHHAGRRADIQRLRRRVGRRCSQRGFHLQLGEAEVEHLHIAAVGHHQVLGLQVAMHDAGSVRGAERVGRLRRVVHKPSSVDVAAIEQRSERLARDELHRDEVDRTAVGRRALADVVDRDEVGMVQRRRGPRLLDEARRPIGVADQVLGQDLQRHRASQLEVVGAIDLAHAAAAEQRADAKPADGRAGQRTG